MIDKNKHDKRRPCLSSSHLIHLRTRWVSIPFPSEMLVYLLCCHISSCESRENAFYPRNSHSSPWGTSAQSGPQTMSWLKLNRRITNEWMVLGLCVLHKFLLWWWGPGGWRGIRLDYVSSVHRSVGWTMGRTRTKCGGLRTSIKLSTRDSFSARCLTLLLLSQPELVEEEEEEEEDEFIRCHTCVVFFSGWFDSESGITIDPYPWKLQTIMEWELVLLAITPCLCLCEVCWAEDAMVKRCVSSFQNKAQLATNTRERDENNLNGIFGSKACPRTGNWGHSGWIGAAVCQEGRGLQWVFVNRVDDDDDGTDKMTLLHYIWGNLITIGINLKTI